MSDLLIRDLPDDVRQRLQIVADREGVSLSRKAADLLSRSLETTDLPARGMSRSDELRAIFAAEGPLDDEFATIMDEIEAARKLDFGRPVDLE